MNNKPYIIYSNNNFIILYKPPYWKVDTQNNYEILSIENQKKELEKQIKPLQLYVKFLLIDKFNKNPLVNRDKLYLDKDGYNEQYNICHRYDNETSGGLLISIKNNNLGHYMQTIADKKHTIKIYLTLVNGKIKQKNGFIYKYIECEHRINHTFCFAYDSKPNEEKNKINSISYYNVIGYIKFNHKVYSLVHVKIFTGKTHQIRLHMHSLGHPVVCDDKYIDTVLYVENKDLSPRMFLHNIFLGFIDKGKPYKFTIPLANDLLNILNKVNKKKMYRDIYDLNYLFDIKLNNN
jgi:23S rRNA pseudouridine1911/1915/1917 synthase